MTNTCHISLLVAHMIRRGMLGRQSNSHGESQSLIVGNDRATLNHLRICTRILKGFYFFHCILTSLRSSYPFLVFISESSFGVKVG